jgi:putative methyltransferase (TIGR04325 family)
LGSEEKLMAAPDVRLLIVDLTPPVFLRLAQRLRRRLRGIGYHTSVPGRSQSVAGVGDGYDDDKYVGLIVTNTLRARKSEPNDDRSWYLILPSVVSQFLDESLTILDFGGGAATGLFCILDHVTGLDLAKLSYVLVETPAMCRAVRDRIVPVLPPLAVKIVEDIPTSLAAPLIVNIGSSIQYISAYRETLARLAGLSPQLIIVSQTPMTDGPTSASQQLHPYKKIAARIFNRSEFVAEMRSLGYACIFMVDHNVPEENGPAFRASMIFRLYSNRGATKD